MPGKPFDYLRRLNSPREVEDSWQLRIAVWASVSISILALALQGVTSMALGLASITLLSVGSFVSWRRRYRPNMVVKVVIMLLTVAALASFLRQVILQLHTTLCLYNATGALGLTDAYNYACDARGGTRGRDGEARSSSGEAGGRRTRG